MQTRYKTRGEAVTTCRANAAASGGTETGRHRPM